MDSYVEYDPEFGQPPPGKPAPSDDKKALTASERVLRWRKKNPDKYREYQRNYMKTKRKNQSQ